MHPRFNEDAMELEDWKAEIKKLKQDQSKDRSRIGNMRCRKPRAHGMFIRPFGQDASLLLKSVHILTASLKPPKIALIPFPPENPDLLIYKG
jgi:hypothetical protein